MRDRIIVFLNNRRAATLVIAATFTLSLVVARPSFQAFKSWRASNLLAESKQLLAEEAFQDSFLKAHAAVLLDRDNIEASRHLAKLALRFNHPQAQRFWETVVNHRDFLTQDWKNAIDACFAKEDYQTAFKYLNAWENSGVDSQEEFELRKVQAYALSENFQLALQAASEATKKFPDSMELHKQFLEVLKIAAPADVQARTAQTILSNARSSYDLEWTARNTHLTRDLRLAALERLIDSPETTVNRQLAYLKYAADLGWNQAIQRTEDIVKRIDITDTETLESLTTLLCSIGNYGEVLKLIDSETASQSRILLRNLLISQISEGDVDDAFDLTSQQRNERLTSIAEETLLRALAFQQTGDVAKFRNNLNQAVTSAESDDLAFLEQQLERLDETEPLLRLYQKVSDSRKFGPQARYLWMRRAVDIGAETEIQNALSGKSDWISQLSNPSQKADAIYYSLIYNIQTENALQQAQELLASYGSDSSFRDLLGLAYLRNDNPKLARAFASEKPDSSRPRSSLIAAAVHGKKLQGEQTLLLAEKELLKL